MRYLKIFEAFNQDKKIEKVNDLVLYFLISSYFEKNTEVIVDNNGGYTFYVKGTKIKKPVLTVIQRVDHPRMLDFKLNSDFLQKRLKRHLGKFLGGHHILSCFSLSFPRSPALEYEASEDIINSIKKYCQKKFNISPMVNWWRRHR